MAIFGKSSDERIDDALDFVLQRCPVPERPAIRKYIQGNLAFFNNNKAYSQKLSTKGVANPGDEVTRMTKRGLILIGFRLNAVHPDSRTAEQVMTMSPLDARMAFDRLLPKFRLGATQEQDDWRLTRNSYEEFFAHPVAFLSENRILTQSAKAGSGLDNVVTYRFAYDYPLDLFRFVPAAGYIPVKGGIDVQVACVPEIYWFDVQGRGSDAIKGSFSTIRPTRLNGADVMVTSGFSGCSFAYKRHGGAVYAAHINPGGGNGGAGESLPGGGRELASQLLGFVNGVMPGKFTQGSLTLNDLKIHGKGLSNVTGKAAGYSNAVDPNSTNTEAKIFGMRKGGRWSFYCQENTATSHVVSELL